MLAAHDTLPAPEDSNGSPQDGGSTDFRAGIARAVVRSLQMTFRQPAKVFRPSAMSTLHLLRVREGVLVTGTHASELSTWQLARHSVQRKGLWKTLWRYMVPPLLINAVAGAATFGAYNQAQSLLVQQGLSSPIALSLAAGACGGAVHTVVTCPIDAFTPYLQSTDKLGRWTLRHSVQRAYQSEGLRGLYRGFPLSLGKDMVGFGIFFAAYDSITRASLLRIRSQEWSTPNKQWFAEVMSVAAAGGVSGVAYQAFSYPVHRLKYIMYHSEGASHAHALACLRALHRQGAIALLFQGMTWSLLRSFSPSALAFMAFEIAVGDVSHL